MSEVGPVPPDVDSTSVNVQSSARTQHDNKDEIQNKPYSLLEYVAIFLSALLTIVTLPLCCLCRFKVIDEHKRAVVRRLGRVRPKPFGPGMLFLLCCTDEVMLFDIRTITFDIPPQEILTKDSLSVFVNAIVYYRVFDPIKSTLNVGNCDQATRLLAASSLRTAFGRKTLSELMEDRTSVAHSVQEAVDEVTFPWGVRVERVEIKDIKLPQSMQRAMAAESEATREARAKIIAAEGEKEASQALKEASEMLAKSSGAIQLRYLQTLAQIGINQNSTIIFPLPMEFLKR